MMFSDIMHVSFLSYQQCDEVDYSTPTVIGDYCSGLGTALVRTYSITIGDNPDYYRLRPEITFYWMFFTFLR